MSQLFGDFRHSVPLLASAPGFSTVAVLILALGIGANTAVFSVVNTLALQPRPGRIDSLEAVFSRDRDRPDSFRDFSYPLYRDLRERRDIFDSLLAHTFSLVGSGDGEAMKRAFGADYDDAAGCESHPARDLSPRAPRNADRAARGAQDRVAYDPGSSVRRGAA